MAELLKKPALHKPHFDVNIKEINKKTSVLTILAIRNVLQLTNKYG